MEDFKVKSAEEVAAMETSEAVKYFNELNQYRADKMESLKEDMEKSNNEAITKQIAELKAEINSANVDQLAILQKAMEEQGTALKQIMSGKGVDTKKTLESILAEKAEDLTDLQNNKNASVKFVVDKAVVPVLSSSIADSTLALRDTRIGHIPRARDVIRQLFKAVSMPLGSGGVVRYVEEVTNVNGAAMQTEGSAKASGSITWVEKLLPLQTIAEFIKVSKQMLNNFSFVAGEIRTKLMRDLQSKIDSKVWNGTGVAPELKGVYTSADTYTPAASGITDANIYDLLIKVIEDIAATTEYMPNVAVMNLTDINKLRLKKDSNHNYVFPTFSMSDGREIAGLTIVESSKVTANTMLVGDFDFATLYSEGSIAITLGYDADDFTKNMITILAEEMLGLLVRNGESGAFRKVTSISAALTTLATS